MNRSALETLKSDEFLVRLGVTGNAKAIHRALERSEEIEAVRLAMYQGLADEEMVRDFVAEILRGFQPGVLFPYDLTLAAVAVVLESRPSRMAEGLLSELARLQRPELPLAIRVAQECRRVQLRQPGNIARVCSMVSPDAMPVNWEAAPTFMGADCDQYREDVTFGTQLCRN